MFNIMKVFDDLGTWKLFSLIKEPNILKLELSLSIKNQETLFT